MEKSELEVKYHRLASEYSKAKSQLIVLKKAVLEEQSKSLNYKDVIKEHEQKLRKYNQEMDSLTFRNDQLLKRVSVLQQELQNVNTSGKKSGKLKGGSSDACNYSNHVIIDEELQKRILENAHLASQLADKDFEMNNYKEKIEWLEGKIRKLSADLDSKSTELESLTHEQSDKERAQKQCLNCAENDKWQDEVARWKTECELLRARPESNEELTEYYETLIANLIESAADCKSEMCSYLAEVETLKLRLESVLLEKQALDSILEKSNEELHTTNENYKSQLDAMTEHLAAQNEKITQQCDEIQILKHALSLKK